jgi:hypothetical protein
MRAPGAVAVALPALLLAACGTTGVVQPTVTVTANAPSGAATSADAPSEDPEGGTSSADDAQARFGQTYTYDNGLAVTVSSTAPFKPSETGICGKASAYVVFTVTVKNGTSERYDPGSFSTSLQSGQSEGKRCFDSAKDVAGSPSTALLTGRTVAWKEAYAVSDPNDLVLEATPGFDYGSVLFIS